MNHGLFYFILYFIGLIITVVLARLILSIPKIVRHLQAQTLLLCNIAEKAGVDLERVRKAYFDAEGYEYRATAKKINKYDQLN